MPIAFVNASSNSGTTGVSTMSWSHTVSAGADLVLVVGVCLQTSGSSVLHTTSITYAGQSLTRIADSSNFGGAKIKNEASVWTLFNPPVGTTTINVTFN